MNISVTVSSQDLTTLYTIFRKRSISKSNYVSLSDFVQPPYARL